MGDLTRYSLKLAMRVGLSFLKGTAAVGVGAELFTGREADLVDSDLSSPHTQEAEAGRWPTQWLLVIECIQDQHNQLCKTLSQSFVFRDLKGVGGFKDIYSPGVERLPMYSRGSEFNIQGPFPQRY